MNRGEGKLGCGVFVSLASSNMRNNGRSGCFRRREPVIPQPVVARECRTEYIDKARTRESSRLRANRNCFIMLLRLGEDEVDGDGEVSWTSQN